MKSKMNAMTIVAGAPALSTHESGGDEGSCCWSAEAEEDKRGNINVSDAFEDTYED